MTQANQWNNVGAQTSLTNKTSGGTSLSSFTSFTYDGVFNLKSLYSSVPGTTFTGTTTNTFDTKDRLTAEVSSGRTPAYSNSFAYDSAGNPTTFKGATRTYNNNNNQSTGTGLTYNANGNPTNYFGTTLAYDPENRMTSYGAALTATYRPDNLRASKTNSSGTTLYYYDTDGEPVLETNSSGTVTAVNVYAPDGLVGRQASGAWTFYGFDPQGNVSIRSDATLSTSTASFYDGYGAEWNSVAPPSTDPFGYNARWGYRFDRETGLYYCQNRYYDATTGRWVTRDPIGAAGGMNVYGYASASPVGSIDPSGLEDYEFTWKVGKLVNRSHLPIRFIFDLGHGKNRVTYYIDLPPGYETTRAVDADWVRTDLAWIHILGGHAATTDDLLDGDGKICGQKTFFPSYGPFPRRDRQMSVGMPSGFESENPATRPRKFPHPERQQPKRENGSTIPLIQPIQELRSPWWWHLF